jgi:NAD(P)H-hydrate epimerase
MRAFDKAATEEYGIPSIVLMENAALRVVEFLEMEFTPLREKRIVVLCGKGNNGGDGFAIARHLLNTGCALQIVFAGDVEKLKGDAEINYRTLASTGGVEIYQASEFADATRRELLEEQTFWQAHIVLDAVFGTGFSGEVRDLSLGIALENLRAAPAMHIAIDIPSGLNADSGEATPQIVRADYIVTFAAPKRGMFVRDGLNKCGEIWVGDIGTPPRLMEETQTGCECITREKASTLLPTRPLDSHKGEAGRVLLIGGSYGMSGAPILAANAVLKSGAGLCIAALPDKILPIFAAAFAEATSHPLPCNDAGQLTEEAMNVLPKYWENVNAVALGPGIGREASTLKLVQRIVNKCPQPLVIDADALYALREIESDLKQRGAPTILTPHPGEMGELMEMSTQDVQNARIDTAIACAQKYNAIVVLKGSRSIVALPDGNTYINLTGNSGMATGGTGDVLTGTIAGLLAQTKDAQSATLLGVYLHGLAGDTAYAEKGNGLIAGDVAGNLPRALVELQKPIEPPVNARLRKLE